MQQLSLKNRYVKFCWWYGCALVYFWFLITAALHAYRYPFRNWDMLAYMGVAESFSTNDPQKIYEATMSDARPVFSPPAYYNLTHRNLLSNSADHFYQQLPFYSVKPLYTGGIWLLHRFGMGMAEATWVLSVISFLALGAIFYFFIPLRLDAGVWWLAIAAFCRYGPSPLAAVAGLSTPDMLCIALSVAAYCLWVYRQSFAGFAACFLLAQLARPDTVLLSSALAIFFMVSAQAPHRMKLAQGIGFVAAAAVIYVLVDYLSGNYGWKMLFYYNFISRSAHPADIVAQFSWQDYMRILHHGIAGILANGRFQLLLAASAVLTACLFAAKEKKEMYVSILWLTWLAFAARFAFFPAGLEDRYYYPYYCIIFYALAEMTADAIKLLQYAAARINTDRHG